MSGFMGCERRWPFIVTVQTPPATPLTDPATARSRLALSATDSTDGDLAAYIAAATAELDAPDGWLGRALGQQTLKCQLESFPNASWGWTYGRGLQGYQDGAIYLPFPPIVSITSITYIDPNGISQTLAPSAYYLNGRNLLPVYGTYWPSTRLQPGAVTITYLAGYATVPAPIIQAVLLRVGQLKSMGRADVTLKQETVMGVGSMTWDSNTANYDQTYKNLLSGYQVFT